MVRWSARPPHPNPLPRGGGEGTNCAHGELKLQLKESIPLHGMKKEQDKLVQISRDRNSNDSRSTSGAMWLWRLSSTFTQPV